MGTGFPTAGSVLFTDILLTNADAGRFLADARPRSLARPIRERVASIHSLAQVRRASRSPDLQNLTRSTEGHFVASRLGHVKMWRFHSNPTGFRTTRKSAKDRRAL